MFMKLIFMGSGCWKPERLRLTPLPGVQTRCGGSDMMKLRNPLNTYSWDLIPSIKSDFT